MKPLTNALTVLILFFGLALQAEAMEHQQLRTVYKGTDIYVIFETPGWVVCVAPEAAESLAQGVDDSLKQDSKDPYIRIATRLVASKQCLLMPVGYMAYVDQIGDKVSGITFTDHTYGQLYLYIPNSYWKPGHDAKLAGDAAKKEGATSTK